jgi:hypothetical protein
VTTPASTAAYSVLVHEGIGMRGHAGIETGAVRPTPPKMTLNDLLDLYLDGLDADGRLSAKTRFDYRHYADDYVRRLLGGKNLHDLTPDAVLAWQRRMAKEGGTKAGKPHAPNTIRLARAPLSGALKLGVSLGLLGLNPAAAVPRPRAGGPSRGTGRPSRRASSSRSWGAT